MLQKAFKDITEKLSADDDTIIKKSFVNDNSAVKKSFSNANPTIILRDPTTIIRFILIMPKKNRVVVLIPEILFVLWEDLIYYINEENRERLHILLLIKKEIFE